VMIMFKVNKRGSALLATGLGLSIMAAMLLGCRPPEEFVSSIKLGDDGFQQTTLEELTNRTWEKPLPIPTYLPEGYEIQEVYIYDKPESDYWVIDYWEIVLLISDSEVEHYNEAFRCKMKLTIYSSVAFLGGFKMPWTEKVDLEKTGHTALLEKRDETNDLYWSIRGYVAVLRAGKGIPIRELTKIAASTYE
jgi:hypothetical protein